MNTLIRLARNLAERWTWIVSGVLGVLGALFVGGFALGSFLYGLGAASWATPGALATAQMLLVCLAALCWAAAGKSCPVRIPLGVIGVVLGGLFLGISASAPEHVKHPSLVFGVSAFVVGYLLIKRRTATEDPRTQKGLREKELERLMDPELLNSSSSSRIPVFREGDADPLLRRAALNRLLAEEGPTDDTSNVERADALKSLAAATGFSTVAPETHRSAEAAPVSRSSAKSLNMFA